MFRGFDLFVWVPATRFRDVGTFDPFPHDLPLLLGERIDSRFPAHAASCLEALVLPREAVQF
jgi:hypothetical protein